MVLERYRRLLRLGDLGAAQAAWDEGRRQGDRSLALEAAMALRDGDKVVTLSLEAWQEADDGVLWTAGEALGLVLEGRTMEALRCLLAVGQGRSRSRCARLENLLQIMALARARGGVAWGHGGVPPRGGQTTTVVMAVAHESGVRVGLGRAGVAKPMGVEAWRGLLGGWPAEVAALRAWARSGPAGWGVDVALSAGQLSPLQWRGRRVDDRHGRLQRLLRCEPRRHVFAACGALLQGWGGDVAEVLPRIDAHFRPWPEEGEGWGGERVEGPLSRHVVWDLGTTQGPPSKGLERVHSLEIVEAPGAVQVEPLLAWLAELPRGQIRRLTLRLAQVRTLGALVRAGLGTHLERLRLVRRVQWDQDWGRAYAALFESADALTGLTVVHRGGLEVLIPALRRLRRLREVELNLREISYARLGALLTALEGNSLDTLRMVDTRLDGLALSTLLRAPVVRGLRSLGLVGCGLPAGSWEVLGRDARGWESLDLSHNKGVVAARSAGAWPRLRELAVEGCGLSGRGMTGLLAEVAQAPIEVLRAGRNALGDEVVWPSTLGGVREADLSLCGLNARGGQALGAWASRERLVRLMLGGNPLGDQGLEAVLGGGAWPALEALDVSGCGLGVAGVQALIDAGIALRALWLVDNKVGYAGCEALAGWPRLASLEELHLAGTQAGRRGGALLAEAVAFNAWVSGLEMVGSDVGWHYH